MDTIKSNNPISQLVESETKGSGSTVIIGSSATIPGIMTINVPGRLLEAASYLKTEYAKYKRLVCIDGNATAAIDAAYKTNSGLYDSESGKICDSIYSLPKSTLALLVLKKEKSTDAFESAAFELAREIQGAGNPVTAAQKLAVASGTDLDTCAEAIARKSASVIKWLDQYNDMFEHPTLADSTEMLYMRQAIIKPRRGFRAMLKLPTGAGKSSKLLHPAIKAYMDAGRKVLVISHRRSIVKNIDIPGLIDYEDVRIGEMAEAKGLKIVVNSLTSEKFKSFIHNVDLVVIDEVAQVIDHALEGSVAGREQVWGELKKVVFGASSVIFADADCNDEALALIKKFDERVSIFKVDQTHTDINCKIGSLDEVRSMAIAAAKAGEKVLMAVDIAKDADAMGKVLEKAGLQPLVITSKTASWSAQAAFIANPNTDEHHVVIYSPAITSALSITSGHFTRHFGLFAGSVTPRSAVQMMRRDRKASEFTIGVQNPQARRQEIALAEFDASGKSSFDQVRYQHMKRTSWLRDNIQHTLPQELKRQGFSLEELATDDQLSTDGWKANSAGRRAVKTDAAKLLLEAQAATQAKAVSTMQNGSKSEQEHFEAIRYFAEKGLKSTTLTFKDCEFWGEGVGQSKLQKFSELHMQADTQLLSIFQDLYQGHVNGQWRLEDTVALYARLNTVRRDAIIAGYEMPRQVDAALVDPKTKQATLTAILKMHGLKTKRVDGGKAGYYYVIDPVSLAQMKGYTGL